MKKKKMNEILKKRIEEAAINGSKHYDPNISKYSQGKQVGYIRGFKEGAEYAISHQWINVEESLPDRKEYDWVLTQIYMDDGFMCVPKVCEIRSDGYWHCAEYDELYKIGESFEKEMGCKVIAWLPIPKFETKEKEEDCR